MHAVQSILPPLWAALLGAGLRPVVVTDQMGGHKKLRPSTFRRGGALIDMRRDQRPR
jgi:hypothetical protein